MRKNPTKNIEQYRIVSGPLASDPSYGGTGAFMIPFGRALLRIVASDGTDWTKEGMPGQPWEHVSVSLQARCPTWGEMDFVKRIFWRDDETVMQLHVPRREHVNHHEFCLHLWRPIGVDIPLPPKIAVGPSR